MQRREPTLQQRDVPFLSALAGYEQSGVIPFHTPGHKQGRGAYGPLKAVLEDALRLDVSDVVAHKVFADSWTRALAAAQQLAARAWGARATRFVANGTSGAIHAAMLAVRSLGYTHVIMPREAHLSVFSAMVLADLTPIYVSGNTLPGWHLTLPPTGAQYEAAYAGSGKTAGAALFATYPTYYGIAACLSGIVAMADNINGITVIDEAHGPHYGFHNMLPSAALSQGADLVAQSTHKILGALTQASMLHIGTGAIPEAAVDKALMLTQSTSPSGLLYASLDAARAQMAMEGYELWERALENAAALRAFIANELHMSVLQGRDMPEAYALDESRLVVRTADQGIHGVDAADRLRQLGIQVELADPWHVVLLITWADEETDLAACRDAFIQLLERPPRKKPAPDRFTSGLPLPQAVLRPREATLAPAEAVPLSQALNRISAETICPYPPGIPVVCPGELIDDPVLNRLRRVADEAVEVRGAADPALNTIYVVR